jgi:hypothetical protein
VSSLRFKLDAPDALEATMTIKMTVAEWRKLSAALEKGRDGWYGPETHVLNMITKIIKQVETTFYNRETDEASE